MSNCLNAHGIEGYNQLTRLIRPHLDLRSFYFGARSVLYRLCVPANENDTSYTRLSEIDANKKGDIVLVEFKPIRKLRISRITYSADTRSALLGPLCKPRQSGDEELGGYFSKQLFCPIVLIFEDVIKTIGLVPGDFKPINLGCSGVFVGSLMRETSNNSGERKQSYVFTCVDTYGKENSSEVISFYITRS